VAAELFKMLAAVDLVHVPYKGGGPAIADAIGGQVQAVFIPAPAGIEYVRGGQLRALGVSSPSRFRTLPEVPSISEVVSEYDAVTWYGVVAPRDTSTAIVQALNNEINAGLADPKLQGRFAELGAEVFPGSPSDFSKLIASEIEKWSKVIRTAKITTD
jgi:tripartite-type tricarboxylate transporter receptor subunit TctC